MFERIVPWDGEAVAPCAWVTRCRFWGGGSLGSSPAGSSAVGVGVGGRRTVVGLALVGEREVPGPGNSIQCI